MTHQVPPRILHGLYFSTVADKPVEVPITTTLPEVETAVATRFPSIETVLGCHAQTKECYACSFDEDGRIHKFLVAFQERPELPPNRALRQILPEVTFRGELVVMKAGVRVLVVDMTGKKQTALAERAVRRCDGPQGCCVMC